MRRSSLVACGLVAAAFALAVSTSALGAGAAGPDHASVKTRDIAVPAASKPKKKLPPLCRKGQKSTKKKPCRKRKPAVAAVQANPPVAGWKFGFTVAQNADETWTLSVGYSRTVGTATENHTYTFQLAPGSATVGADLSTFTLDTGAQLGQFGQIKVTLANPGALGSGTAPSGCTSGTWQTRSGTLTGSVRFVADGTYFKTLLATSLPADVLANTSGTPATCGPLSGTCFHANLMFGGQATTAEGSFYASTRDNTLTVLVFFTQSVGPAKLTHLLFMTGLPVGNLTLAPDLSTGKLVTDGAAPWFTGSLAFAAAGPPTSFGNTSCGGGTISFAQGSVTGDLTGHFAAVPAHAAPPGQAYVETL